MPAPYIGRIYDPACGLGGMLTLLKDRIQQITTREPMQNNPNVRQRPGQRGLKPETLPPLLPSSFSRFIFQSGQLFSSMQIPVCPGFLAKNTHDGPLVVNEKALSYAF